MHADDGTSLRYDKLILATGSRSFFPPMEGLWADNKNLADGGVFGFRTLDDTATMITEAENRSKGVVIGGGLLGLEAARGGLQSRGGLTVDVVHAGPTLMNAQLDDPAGAILRKSVEALGIGVHTEKRTTEVVVSDGRLTGIRFSDGSLLDCDMLVIATGIRPNVGLAQRAGLTVERAIVTDDRMRSVDDDDVYVVGGMRPAPRSGLWPGGAAVGAGQGAGRPSDGGELERCLSRFPGRHETQGRRRRRRLDGRQGA